MMPIGDLLTDASVLAELGSRLERHRLQRNLTQAEAAEAAGIGRATLQRIERGESVQAVSLIKLLRALELLQSLDGAIPEPLESPIAAFERQQRRGRRRASPRSSRRRASPRRGRDSGDRDREPWSWGEEPTRQ